MVFRFATWSAGTVLSVAICLSPISPATAKTRTSQPLFEQDAPLEMEFEMDFAKVCHDPTSGGCEDLPAKIQYIDDRGFPIILDVKLRTRGRWRRDTSNCDLPALFVYFDATQVEGTLFENQTMLPFTTHCKSYNRVYHRYTMLEYLAYRYYNLLTDNSLRARLTYTKFRDSGGSFRSRRYGFFTEHFQRAASRMGAEFIEREDQDPREIDPMELATLSTFQFMIGNLDWSVLKSHNIALFRREDGTIIPLPFDFDYSGLVNAEYAVPPKALHLYSIRVRKYRGFCRSELNWEELFGKFFAIRTPVMQLINDMPAKPNKFHSTRVILKSSYQALPERIFLNDWVCEVAQAGHY